MLGDAWFRFDVDPSINLYAAGIYQWSIPGVGVYVGKTKVLQTRLKAYVRDVGALIDGKPWRGDPTKAYPVIYEALRQARDAGVLITLSVLEACGPGHSSERERYWLQVRRDEAAEGGPKLLNAR